MVGGTAPGPAKTNKEDNKSSMPVSVAMDCLGGVCRAEALDARSGSEDSYGMRVVPLRSNRVRT